MVGDRHVGATVAIEVARDRDVVQLPRTRDRLLGEKNWPSLVNH